MHGQQNRKTALYCLQVYMYETRTLYGSTDIVNSLAPELFFF